MSPTVVKLCSTCKWWDHAHKRNVGYPDRPFYYSSCQYPLEDLKLPDCLNRDEMSEIQGSECSCWKEK